MTSDMARRLSRLLLLIVAVGAVSPAQAAPRHTVAAQAPTATGPPGVHVSDIDAGIGRVRGTWRFAAAIELRDEFGKPVRGVRVLGRIDHGKWRRLVRCRTSSKGRCVTKSILRPDGDGDVTFTVTALKHGAYPYRPESNADRDGSSDGTKVTGIKPPKGQTWKSRPTRAGR